MGRDILFWVRRDTFRLRSMGRWVGALRHAGFQYSVLRIAPREMYASIILYSMDLNVACCGVILTGLDAFNLFEHNYYSIIGTILWGGDMGHRISGSCSSNIRVVVAFVLFGRKHGADRVERFHRMRGLVLE
jgi:hypothetical protein